MAALPRSRKLLCSGREETPDRKKPRCGTGSWYPPLCLQHLEKQRNGAASVCAGSGKDGPARHHVTRKCRIILFTLVIPRAPLGPKNLLSRRIASTQQMPRLPIRLVFLPPLAAWRKVQTAVREANHFKRDDVPRINRN